MSKFPQREHDLNIGPMRRVLDGDISGISKCFVWAESPQGSTYWHTIYKNNVLPDHDREQLRAWLALYIMLHGDS